SENVRFAPRNAKRTHRCILAHSNAFPRPPNVGKVRPVAARRCPKISDYVRSAAREKQNEPSGAFRHIASAMSENVRFEAANANRTQLDSRERKSLAFQWKGRRGARGARCGERSTRGAMLSRFAPGPACAVR